MAEKTKDELEAEIKELREKVENNAPLKDTSWYEEQLSQKDKRIEILENDIQGVKEKEEKKEREKKMNRADEKRQEKLTAAMIQRRNTGRFPLRDRPTSFPRRSLDGTAGGPVFDLGVQLENYDGAVFVPLSWVKEMGRSIGMLAAEEADLLKEEVHIQRSRNEVSVALAEELQSGINDLVGKFNTTLAGYVPEPMESDAGEEESTGNGSNSDNGENESPKATGQTNDDNNVEESSGVSSDSDDAANKSESGKSKSDDDDLSEFL